MLTLIPVFVVPLGVPIFLQVPLFQITGDVKFSWGTEWGTKVFDTVKLINSDV